jgi:hypothetical protein
MPNNCAAITRRGEQCRGLVLAGGEYCSAHDPDRAEARRRAASKAGRAKSGSEVSDLKATLKQLFEDTRAGRIPTSIGQTCATIAGVQLKLLDVELKEREVVVRERELAEIRLPEFQRLEDEVAALRELVEDPVAVAGHRRIIS